MEPLRNVIRSYLPSRPAPYYTRLRQVLARITQVPPDSFDQNSAWSCMLGQAAKAGIFPGFSLSGGKYLLDGTTYAGSDYAEVAAKLFNIDEDTAALLFGCVKDREVQVCKEAGLPEVLWHQCIAYERLQVFLADAPDDA